MIRFKMPLGRTGKAAGEFKRLGGTWGKGAVLNRPVTPWADVPWARVSSLTVERSAEVVELPPWPFLRLDC